MNYRVVVRFDGSCDGAMGLQWAAEHAARRDGEVWITHAFESVNDQVRPGKTAQRRGKQRKVERRDIDRRINEILARAPAVRTRRYFVADLPGRAIVALARRADVVVVGAHGADIANRSRLGTTPRACLCRPHCPIVVLSTLPTVRSGSIVVGDDGSPASRRAQAWALVEARRRAVPVTVVDAAQLSQTGEPAVPDGQTTHPLATKWVITKEPTSVIDVTRTASLLVVGVSAGQRDAESVTEECIRNANCPVAIIPEAGLRSNG